MLPWSMRSSVWLLAVGLLVLFTLPLLYPSSIADKSAKMAFAAIREGATEQNVRQALKIADAMSPCVLFLDEVEKALSGLGGVGGD